MYGFKQYSIPCDELEAGLLRSQADSERLMEAVLSRVVDAPE